MDEFDSARSSSDETVSSDACTKKALSITPITTTSREMATEAEGETETDVGDCDAKAGWAKTRVVGCTLLLLWLVTAACLFALFVARPQGWETSEGMHVPGVCAAVVAVAALAHAGASAVERRRPGRERRLLVYGLLAVGIVWAFVVAQVLWALSYAYERDWDDCCLRGRDLLVDCAIFCVLHLVVAPVVVVSSVWWFGKRRRAVATRALVRFCLGVLVVSVMGFAVAVARSERHTFEANCPRTPIADAYDTIYAQERKKLTEQDNASSVETNGHFGSLCVQARSRQQQIAADDFIDEESGSDSVCSDVDHICSPAFERTVKAIREMGYCVDGARGIRCPAAKQTNKPHIVFASCESSCPVVFNCGCDGRPFVVDNRTWLADVDVAGAGDKSARAASAAARVWLDQARGEHASVASFAAFSLRLMALGAPLELLDAATRAGRDEVRHAQLCLARAAARLALPPSRLTLGALAPEVINGVSAQTRDELALSTLDEGAVGEFASVLGMIDRLGGATDAADAGVLHTLIGDELRHVALAVRTLLWLTADHAVLARRVRRRFTEHINRLTPVGPAALCELLRHLRQLIGSDRETAHALVHSRDIELDASASTQLFTHEAALRALLQTFQLVPRR